MMRHVFLKGFICKALIDIQISKKEVEEIDPNAMDFFNFKTNTMDKDADIDAIKEADDDDKDNDNDNRDAKLLSIPFELFHTGIGYGITTKWVTTKALLAIICNVENGKILHKLFLCMKIDKHIFPSIQYILVGMANLLGP